MSTPVNLLSVPEDTYFHSSLESVPSLHFTAKFQSSLLLTWTLTSFPFPPSLLSLSPYDPAIPCYQPALCLLRNLSEPSPLSAVCRVKSSLNTVLGLISCNLYCLFFWGLQFLDTVWGDCLLCHQPVPGQGRRHGPVWANQTSPPWDTTPNLW